MDETPLLAVLRALQEWNRSPEDALGHHRPGLAAQWPSAAAAATAAATAGEEPGSPENSPSPKGLLGSPRRRGCAAGSVSGAETSAESFVRERLSSLLEELATLGGGRLGQAEFNALGLVLAEKCGPAPGGKMCGLSSAAGAPRLPAEPAAVLRWVFDGLQAGSESTKDRPSGKVGDDCGDTMRVVGVRRSTALRSVGDLTPRLMISDCHDAAVYCLLAADYCLVQGCSDCTIVVGAVGRCLRVEGCSRVTVISGCGRAVLSSCHDSTFHLGVNTPPLLLGDERSLQLAPFNTAYDGLEEHLRLAGIDPATSLWDTPEAHGVAEPTAAGQLPEVAAAFHLLPPGSFAPFVVPFKTPNRDSEESAGAGTGSARARNPFKLPEAYAQAVQDKVDAVKELRETLRQAGLDEGARGELQSCIQGHFKDWLHASGNLRQIYDLALMEQEGPVERSAD